MIYFTSDLHLGHHAIIHMCNRPFHNVDEMNKTIISNWNRLVHKNDIIYILGDIAHRIPITKLNELIKKLNGRKILIRGNHDKRYDESLFEEVCDFKVIKHEGLKISLMHYPLLEWPYKYRSGIHLHGHQHNTYEYNLSMLEKGIKRYDVGVDANDFQPVSLTDIIRFFGL